ncbi:hypothetical protein V8F20_010842 [Naviculisporaceae sp. PSN 640]
MTPDRNPYRRGQTTSPPRKPGVDMESASLLDEETKAMRARVIAHLMLPIPAGGGLSLNRLVANLRERVESSCEKIYRDGKPVPEIISANYVHIHSWLGYKADIFQGKFSSHLVVTHKLEEQAKSDLAELVLNVWQTVAVQHHSPDEEEDPWHVSNVQKKTSATVSAQMEAGAWFFERFKRKPPMTNRRRPVARMWSFDRLPGMGNGMAIDEQELRKTPSRPPPLERTTDSEIDLRPMTGSSWPCLTGRNHCFAWLGHRYLKDQQYYGNTPPHAPFTIDTDYDLLRDPTTPCLQPLRDQVDRFCDMKATLAHIYGNADRPRPRLRRRAAPLPALGSPEGSLVDQFDANSRSLLMENIVYLEQFLGERDLIVKQFKMRMSNSRLQRYEAWRKGDLRLPEVSWQSPNSRVQTSPETSGEMICDGLAGLSWNAVVEVMQVMFKDPAITIDNAEWFIKRKADEQTRDAIFAAGTLCQAIRGRIDPNASGWNQSVAVQIAFPSHTGYHNLGPASPGTLQLAGSVALELDKLQPDLDRIVERYLPELILESEISGSQHAPLFKQKRNSLKHVSGVRKPKLYLVLGKYWVSCIVLVMISTDTIMLCRDSIQELGQRIMTKL